VTGFTWGSSKPKTKGEKKYLKDLVDLADLTADYKLFRPIGPVWSFAEHWFDIKKDDGMKISIPKTCLNYNPLTQDFEENGCPYCQINQARQVYLNNVIDREEQENEPRKAAKPTEEERKLVKFAGEKYRFKQKGSKTWTPVKVLRLPAGLAAQMQNLASLNRVKIKGEQKIFEITHPKYGLDINIKYDAKVKGPNKYDLQKDDRTALKEEELEYLIWRLDVIEPEKISTAQADFKSLKERLLLKEESKDDPLPKEERKSKKSKAKSKDDDEDDDDYLEDVIEEFDLGSKPKKKKKKR
jgi:hypothetical protein